MNVKVQGERRESAESPLPITLRERGVELVGELGIAVAPVVMALNLSHDQANRSLKVAIGQTEAALREWVVASRNFMRSSGMSFKEEEVRLDQTSRNIVRVVRGAAGEIAKSTDNFDQLAQQTQQGVTKLQNEMADIVLSMPTDIPSELIGAMSPYKAYTLVKAELDRARSRITYIDRYLSHRFFDLYLRKLPRNLEVQLVTTKGKVGAFGVEDVIGQSKLAAAEFRSLTLYELSQSHFHDRNIRVDDLIFTLGPSLEHAGAHPLNFAKVDSSPAGHKVLDDLIGDATLINLK